jgi:hypothetical protein
MSKLSLYVIGLLLIAPLAACSSSDQAGSTSQPSPPSTPAPCLELPWRQQAVGLLDQEIASRLTSVGANPVEPTRLVPDVNFSSTNFFDYDAVKNRTEEVRLINSASELAADPGIQNFHGLTSEIDWDWTSESILIALQWPNQFVYRFGIQGDHLTMYAGHLLPCDAYDPATFRLLFDASPAILRVSRA